MTDKLAHFGEAGSARLRAAAEDFSRVEILRLVEAVLEDLRTRPANGTFDEVAARHFWDEYCWALQEGPFDNDIGWDDVQLGSLSDAFDDLARAVTQAEVEKLPGHALVFLTVHAIAEDATGEEWSDFGAIWVDGIVAIILDRVKDCAASRNLDLIGPHRGDVIGYEIEGSGMVWTVLSETGEMNGIIINHTDAFIDPAAVLSEVADEMVSAFILALAENEDRAVLSQFLECFTDQVRRMVLELDVLPSLEEARTSLVDRLGR